MTIPHRGLWRWAALGARLLLGVIFFAGGMSKLIPFPGIIGPVWLEEVLQPHGLGSYARFIAWSEALIGLLLFTRRFATAGAIMLVPLIVNILAVTISLEWRGTPLVLAFFLLLNVYLLAYDWDRLRSVIFDGPAAEVETFGSWRSDGASVAAVILCLLSVPLHGVNQTLGYTSVVIGLALLASAPLRRRRRAPVALVPFTGLFSGLLAGLLLLAGLHLGGPLAAQQSVPEAARSELNRVTSGIVAGLLHEGELDFLDSWGFVAHDDSTELQPDRLFPFSGFTEILIATTVRALSAGGALDDQRPIGNYLPELPDRLGAITLDQLLTHTAGLDDAVLLEGEVWATAIEKLPNEALFTEPGLVYSRSRYSYPLAGRVLERAFGLALAEVITTAVLQPLGMRGSTFDLGAAKDMGLAPGYSLSSESPTGRDAVEPKADHHGLPVIFTTVPDVLQFLATKLSGAINGDVSLTSGAIAARSPDAPQFLDGFRFDDFRGAPRAYHRSTALGFGAVLFVLPESNTAMVLWGNGQHPTRTARMIERAIAATLELPPAGPPTRPEPGEVTGPEDFVSWVGTYRNGEYIIVLRLDEGRLVFFDGNQDLTVRPVAADLLAASIDDGRVAVVMQLIEAGGYRFLRVDEKAYQIQPAEEDPT